MAVVAARVLTSDALEPDETPPSRPDVLDLVSQGLTTGQIAARFGVSERQVHRRLAGEMKGLAHSDLVWAVKMIVNDQLEQMECALYQEMVAADGDVPRMAAATRAWLKVIEQKRRLLGLDLG